MLPQKLKLQSTAQRWRKATEKKADWITCSAIVCHSENGIWDAFKQAMTIKSLACPKCEVRQDVTKMKLKTKAGFSSLKCKAKSCEQVTLSSMWKCCCRIQWVKCPLHVHASLVGKVAKQGASLRMKARSSRKARGGEVQMPVKRYSKAKGNFTNRIEMHEYTYSPTQLQSARSRIRLQPGTRLAAKFPHLVKAAAPT